MKIAISIGDLNGVGIEIALRSHGEIKKIVHPIYIINSNMLKQASKMLNIPIPKDFEYVEIKGEFKITPSRSTKESGEYSYKSFQKAIKLAKRKEVHAICTLPINKNAWEKAGVKYKGHTDALADILNKEAIMMIGCDKLFVALFTHHIALKDVPKKIKTKKLINFMINLYNEIKEKKIGVLALNPHAGDNGVMGDEEKKIKKAIKKANDLLLEEVFIGPLVPDTAFTSQMREKIKYFVCMYHDQGLIPTKTLYFEEGINVSLNLPIIRTSVDHGTAYDIAYKNKKPSNTSYINAIKEALKLSVKKGHYKI